MFAVESIADIEARQSNCCGLTNNYLAKVEHIIPINAQLADPFWVGPVIMGRDEDASLIHRTNGHIPVDTAAVILGHTGVRIYK